MAAACLVFVRFLLRHSRVSILALTRAFLFLHILTRGEERTRKRVRQKKL